MGTKMSSNTAFISPIHALNRPTFTEKCSRNLSHWFKTYNVVADRRAHVIPTAELTQDDTEKVAKARMEKTIESVVASFNTVRTGRATPALLDRIMVSYYGAETPLNQLASVSTSGTSTLVIDSYDKSAIQDIERAILESDLGLTPNNDGSVIRLTIPPLTQERRVALVKQVKGMAEDGRVAIRNIRRDAVESLKKMEKNKELGKDESKSLQDDIQKLTDKFVKQIDQLYKQKDADIMKV